MSDLKTAREIWQRLDAECDCENRATRSRVIPKGRCWTCRDQILAEALAARGDEERERAAKVAENPYSDAVQAYGADEPFAVGRKIAAAIRDGGRDGK